MPHAAACSEPDHADRFGCDWTPDALSMPGVVFGAATLVVGLMAGLVLLADRIAPPVPPTAVTVQLMDAAGALLEPAMPVSAAPAVTDAPVPASPPDDPVPQPVPPASVAPLPVMEPPMAEASIPIAPTVSTPHAAVPARPLPRPTPIRHTARPTPQPALVASRSSEASEQIAAPPAVARPPASTPVSAPADVSSGLGAYGAGLHRQIERNMLADRRVTQLGVSGTAMIEATIASDGRVMAARLARSSGIGAIDGAALGAVQRGGFPPFGPHMPAGPITVTVPIAVEAD